MKHIAGHGQSRDPWAWPRPILALVATVAIVAATLTGLVVTAPERTRHPHRPAR